MYSKEPNLTNLLMEEFNDKDTKSVDNKLTRRDLVDVHWGQVTLTRPLGVLDINVGLRVVCPWNIKLSKLLLRILFHLTGYDQNVGGQTRTAVLILSG